MSSKDAQNHPSFAKLLFPSLLKGNGATKSVCLFNFLVLELICRNEGVPLLSLLCIFIFQEWTNDQIESDMKIVLETVTKVRSLRPATDKNEKRAVFALCRTPQAKNLIESYKFLITTLASLSSIKVPFLSSGSLCRCEPVNME